jgi:hypothetical protein
MLLTVAQLDTAFTATIAADENEGAYSGSLDLA